MRKDVKGIATAFHSVVNAVCAVKAAEQELPSKTAHISHFNPLCACASQRIGYIHGMHFLQQHAYIAVCHFKYNNKYIGDFQKPQGICNFKKRRCGHEQQNRHDAQISSEYYGKKGNNRSVNYISVQLCYTNSTQQIF